MILTLGSRTKAKKKKEEEKSGTSQDGTWSGEKSQTEEFIKCDLKEISKPYSHRLRVGIFCEFCCRKTSYFCDCEKSYDHYYYFFKIQILWNVYLRLKVTSCKSRWPYYTCLLISFLKIKRQVTLPPWWHSTCVITAVNSISRGCYSNYSQGQNFK